MKNTGFYNKYQISRTDGMPMNPENEYFILKIAGEGDYLHINACRKALMVYADEIETHLPELSKDLRQKYGDLNEKKFKSITPEIYDTFTKAEKEEYCRWLFKHVNINFDMDGDPIFMNLEFWDWNDECFYSAWGVSGIDRVFYRIKPPEPAEEV